jgi:hypothetical protein
LIGGLLIEHRRRGKIVLITGVAQKLAAVSNQRTESSLTIPVYRATCASSESSFVNDVFCGFIFIGCDGGRDFFSPSSFPSFGLALGLLLLLASHFGCSLHLFIGRGTSE